MSASSAVPIAIIGMGCRFPGGVASPAGLWDLVVAGRDTVGPVPVDRWDAARLMALQDPDEAARYGRGCFLEGDVWAWDPEALGVAPSEQAWIDPQFRVLMETAWEAVEHAGIPVDRVRGSRTGVYVGAYVPDNLFRESRPVEDALDSAYMFGNFTGTMVGRLAFGMDLRGPVLAINTMCSSGLVAVDTACTALTAEDCDLALAGATMLMVSPETQHYEASLLLSGRGRCFAFDGRADGYVRGEGVGTLVLKRLGDARRDGDRVLAVIRGSAVNNDGQATRLTAPSTQVQQELYRAAVDRAGVDPGDVGLVEAHGPGTAIGDPVEYTSINAVYGRGRGRCALGSVKTNIGHSEPTSGIAATIKAVQALRHGAIPPNLNFASWNPAIPLDEHSRLFVPTELTQWPVTGEPRLAAVCSYGVTGTNAHVVVEQPPQAAMIPAARHRPTPSAKAPLEPARLFTLSAASPDALPLAARQLADWTEQQDEPVAPADLAHTLAVRRAHAPYRLCVTARTPRELASRSRSYADGAESAGIAAGGVVLPEDHAGPVLVFTGQGSQWAGMCQGLLDTDPVFTAALDEIAPLIASESGFSLREMLTGPEHLVGVERIQPTLFAIQVALAALWRSWGIVPAAVIGQSLGEVAAAVVAGGLSLADGVAVICRRATLLAETAGGAMASVLLPADQVEADITAASAVGVSIAVLTAPETTVISGAAEQVDALVIEWQAAGVVARLVNVDVASHSAQMDPILDRLDQVLTGLGPRTPAAVFYSTVTDDPRDPGPLDHTYWVRNQRDTVRFHGAVSAALADGHRLFVECAPHPLAVRAITDIARHDHVDNTVTVGSLRRDTDDHDAFLAQVGAAHCAGVALDWAGHYGDGALVEAPGTAWNRSRHGGDTTPYRLVAPGLVGADQHPLLGGYVQDPDQPGRHLWQTPVSPARLPWLADHQVAGVPVLPGTGIAEMMLAAATRVFGTAHVEVCDLVLASPLVLDPEPVVTTRVITTDDGARVEVVSGTDTGTLVHAHATVRPLPDTGPTRLDTDEKSTAGWQETVPAEVYRLFRERHGIYHGPAFAGVERIQLDPHTDQALATVRLDDRARVSAWMMAAHPVLTDELVHAVVAVWVNRYATSPGPVVVAGFDAVRVYGPTAQARRTHVTLHEADDLHCTASGQLATADGQVVAEIQGLRLANVTPPTQRFTSRLMRLDWVPADLTVDHPDATIEGRWLVINDGAGSLLDLVTTALGRGGIDSQLTCLVPGDGPAEISTVLGDAAFDGVILVVGDHPGAPPCDLARRRVGRVCDLIGVLAARASQPRLWVTTPAPAPLAAAGVRGVVRTAAYECPTLAASLAEIDTTTDPARLATMLLATTAPVEIRWQDNQFQTARLQAEAPASGPAPVAVVRPDGAYLISGGLGGLGLSTATWLAERGAGRVVLMGRSQPSPHAEQVLADMTARGTTTAVVRGDVGDPQVVADAVTAAEATGLTLRGVCHAAGVLDDATLGNITSEALARVWRGKAHGAWNLHHATLDKPLDWWVAYSSIAAAFGAPGQATHAAANTWLDELALWRTAQGLPATSIQWGAWSKIGSGQHLADRGLAMITPTDGIDALERILAAGHTCVAYSPIDPARWLATYPAALGSALFTDLLTTTHDDARTSPVLDDLLVADTDDQRHGILCGHIIDCVRDLLGGTTRHITPTTSLVILGIDSLGAVQLQNRLQHNLNITIEQGVIWVKPTPTGLADWILRRMGFGAEQHDHTTDEQKVLA